MSLFRPFMLIITSFLLASCAGTSPDANKPKVRKSLSEQLQDNLAASIANVPPSLMGNGPGTQQATQLTASTQEEMLASADSGAVFFTDPYNSDASIPGLDEAFTRKKENQRWIQSYSSALREAQRTGYPILIWFHHSKGSPPSRKLAADLLHTREFEEWAKENIIRVCYDQAEEFESEPNAKKRSRMKEYVSKAPSLFGVRGTPVLLIMSPDGTKVDTLRGYYNGQIRLYFDQIKNSDKLANQQYEKFKKTLIPKGYRTWTGANGNTLFAKLSRYSEKDQAVWLQEFDGHQNKTSLRSLSEEDRKWILDQKAARKASAPGAEKR